jgi:WD40 repeat protein
VAAATPGAYYWTSVLRDDTVPGEASWTHLWVSASRLHDDHLTGLLRLAADDETADLRDGLAVPPLRRWCGCHRSQQSAPGGGPVAFSPGGQRLAAACADHDVRLWNLGRPAAAPLVLRGHTDLVRAVAFSADGALLASGSDDGTVRLWDGRTGAPQGVLTSGTAPVRAVAFSPDGQQLASGGADHSARLWDVCARTPRPMP